MSKKKIDATVRQQKPTNSDGLDVADRVKSDILNHEVYDSTMAFNQLITVTKYVLYCIDPEMTLDQHGSQIAEDIEKRVEIGAKKYGTRLKTNNGRDAKIDLYEELLDALNYFKQAQLEGNL